MSPTQNIRKEGYILVGSLLFIGLIGCFFISFIKVWSTADVRDREKELRFSLIQLQRGVNKYEMEYGYLPGKLEDLDNGSYIRKHFRDPFREKRDSKWHEDWDYDSGIVSSRSKKESLSGTEYSQWIAVMKQKKYEIEIREQEVD
jgi:competence protein ComGC